jgi:superfamily II DNA or RNA helicase
MSEWAAPTGVIGRLVDEQTQSCLEVYRADPKRVEEDAKIELTAAEGGYGRKQIFELLQNAADALKGSPGRIQVILADHTLYVANAGRPFAPEGVKSILASHLSRKSDEHIGQFGLGFKSVLAVTDGPIIVSRSGSFRFDREWSRQQITDAGIGSPRYPVLRLAQPFDPHSLHDSTLGSLMEWAQTIVVLPIKAHRDMLADDVAGFPSEFLLFSPDITEVTLEDRHMRDHRSIRLTSKTNGELALEDGGKTTTWKVATRTHCPSRTASRDAGELGQRDRLDLIWACPRGSTASTGQFWAYFPTLDRTTLSGIVNAPWKLTSDRLRMLAGPFNEELLKDVLPAVVRDALPSLLDASDPAGVLDPLPARGREARSWADDVINEPIYEAVARSSVLPDCTGHLSPPSGLKLHPAGLSHELKTAWLETVPAQEKTHWVHHSVDQTDARRSKAERLLGKGGGRVATLALWLEALVRSATPEQSALALLLAADIFRADTALQSQIRDARIVLLDNGTLTRPIRGQVFVRSEGQGGDHDYVHPELAASSQVEEALNLLGIKVLNPEGRLRSTLQRPSLRPDDWRTVWELSRQIDTETAVAILRDELPSPLTSSVKVQVHSGKWKLAREAFLGGDIIPSSGERDADFLISPSFHRDDEELLRRLGAVSVPRPVLGAEEEPWLRAYKDKYREQYHSIIMRNSQLGQIEITGEEPPWPLEIMPLVSGPARVAMSQAILRSDRNRPWTVRHRSRGNPHSVAGPAVQRLKHYGFLPTSIGQYPAKACLHPDADLADLLPVADVGTAWANSMNLPKDPQGWSPETWRDLIRATEQNRPEKAASLYALAASRGVQPPEKVILEVSGQWRRVTVTDVAATADPSMARSLALAGIACLVLPDEAGVGVLADMWSVADARDMLREEIVAVPDSEPSYLTDRFPPLKIYCAEAPGLEQLEMQTCSSITVLVSTPRGQVSRSPRYHREGNLLSVLNETDEEILRTIASALHLDINISGVLKQIRDSVSNKRRIAIKRHTSISNKLVEAVGVDGLRRHLPAPALTDLSAELGRDLSGEETAHLALAVHGFGVLAELRQELEDIGLEPPRTWAGLSEARRFVEGLGFPVEYAGFASSALPPKLEIDGPMILPPLHDYQEGIVARIKELLQSERDRRRGLVSLPTGAGKTRVAVQSLVEMVTAGQLNGIVVWIAQTEELCEQAVQSWAEIWRGMGPSEPLTLSRFWASNDVEEAPEAALQVVIATIAKLNQATGNDRYAWLQDPGLIVIDEAHSSVAPSYSQVFRWLGQDERLIRVKVPMIGLTATPFRGVNEVETKNLVNRYDGVRLDEGVFGNNDPYEYLQREGVLSSVRQIALEGVDVAIDAMVEQHFKHFGGAPSTLPPKLEERLGQNTERNGAIVRSILGQPREWPILVFATSVENARVLAAELTYHGVSARPIVQGTPPALRRRYIDDFRRGEIRVLTNFNVLTQGFDAPKVRAVYVTRPTFSPNLYQQMIGRGLRGPRNGGSDEVLIVNVRDNLSAYGEMLAFHHFEYLWNRSAQA